VNAQLDQVTAEGRGQVAGVREDIAELKGSMKNMISISQSRKVWLQTLGYKGICCSVIS